MPDSIFEPKLKMTRSLEEDIPIKSCETDFNSELECAAEELCFQSSFLVV